MAIVVASNSGCDLTNLAQEWDGCDHIRDQLRSGKPLFAEVSDKQVDINCPSSYKYVLLPILTRMYQSPLKKLPAVDDLRNEVAAVLEMNKRDPDASDVVKTAWLIRKYLGFVKMKCRRQEVSIVT